jgi:hypothetical protein
MTVASRGMCRISILRPGGLIDHELDSGAVKSGMQALRRQTAWLATLEMENSNFIS